MSERVTAAEEAEGSLRPRNDPVQTPDSRPRPKEEEERWESGWVCGPTASLAFPKGAVSSETREDIGTGIVHNAQLLTNSKIICADFLGLLPV